jgi:hypothetical protein
MTKRVAGIFLALAVSLSAALVGCGGGSSSGGSSALSIANAAPPAGTVGTAYSYSFTATGGTTPYAWNVASGQLPAGLKLNSSSGAVTGTPTAATTSSFTISVKDASAKTAMQAVSIGIAAQAPPAFSNGNPPAGVVGTAYSFSFTATGGKTPYSWSVVQGSGNLPGGTALNSSTGLLSGIPTTPGTFNFTMQVKDANAAITTQAYSIVIAPGPPPSITSGNPPSGVVGTSYSFTFTATAGKTPYAWGVVVGSGNLPPGLSLNSATGVLSGTPTAPPATATFTIQVTDGNGQSATHAYSLLIAAAPSPSITNGNPPDGTAGTAYSFIFTASGGTQPYSWNVTAGQLPAGLTLKVATGVLSGTPSASGTFAFTVTVTDVNASTASQAYTVNIAASLNSISVTPILPSIDVAGTQQFTATGNYSDGSHQDITAAVTWSSSATTMVSITSSGLGTALMTGSTPATITATLGTVSGTTQMNVKAPNVITVGPTLPVVGIGGGQNFTATGKFPDGTIADLTHFVTWTSGATGIATVTRDGKGIGVTRGLVSITATNSGVSGSATLDVTDKNFSDSSLNGDYAFTLVSFDSRGPVFESGSITTDGNGAIVSGVEDINAASVTTNIPLSGSYAVTPDGRGLLTLTGNAQTRTFNVILKANSAAAGDTNGQLIQNDLQTNAIGTLQKQDATAFHNSALANTTYVFRAGGIDPSGQISTVGLMTTNSTGGTVSGSEDMNDAGTVTSSTPFSGTIGSIDASTGRGLASIAGHNFALYVISATQLQLVEIDSTLPALAGIAEAQTAVAPPASGGYTFDVDTGGTQGRSWLIGQFDYSGTTVSDGVQLQDGGVTLTVVPTGMAFVFDGTGRGTFIENTNSGYRNFVAYVVSPQKMYLMLLNDSHAASGTAELQQPGSGFTTASLSGDFAFGAAETGESQLTFVGQFVFDGNGNFYGVDDLSQPGASNSVPLQGGTYTVSANGQVIMTVPSGGQIPAFSLFLISPNKGLFLGTPDPDVNGVAESQ